MAKTKKLDIFNLFYSGAAVVILIGVIAKLLEWPAQDILITSGLAIEAIVFGVSSIRFIETKKDNEVATEATLSKMAEGLGSISSGVRVGGYGKNASGIGNSYLGNNSNNGYLSNDNLTPNYTESSWKLLEQMDVLTLAKDMFYHPSWVNLKSDEYAQLTQLFKSLFDKKLPSKDALPFLIKFPVAFPISDFDTLLMSSSHTITLVEMEILYKSLNIAGANYLFENAVIEEKQTEIIIRQRKDFEIQIFGGESAEVIAHVKKFHEKSLIISPTQYYLLDTINLKEAVLINYLIEQADIANEHEVLSLSKILNNKSDETKQLFWNRFDKVTYDAKSGAGYLVFKAIVESAAHFQNSNNGSSFLLNKIEIITDSNTKISRNDVINFNDEVVYFGNEKEYNVKLNELFSSEELENRKYFEDAIDKLLAEEGFTKEGLLQLFKLNKEDTVEDLLKTLNHHLAKTNSTASGAQLSFVLLCKVFVNS
jgi:hypothetical protein